MSKRNYLLMVLLFLGTFITTNQTFAQCETGIQVTTVEGATTVYTCPGDGNDDIIQFAHTGTPENFVYVVTDNNNIILGIPPSNQENFEGAPVGLCRVWGFSYTGEILAEPGEHVFSTFFATGCWAISNTCVDVIRDMPDGGTVAMPNGATERTVCTTDGYDDPVVFTHQTTSTSAYRYVITDDQNNILGFPPQNGMNFEGVPTGICRVWGLSYTGSITAEVGDNAAVIALSDDCFDLSDNFITITRTNVQGGMVATTSGETNISTCTQDGMDDIVMFQHDSGSSANYAYIITDENNHVLGLPPANMQNFDGAPAGTCRVWGISYTGDLKIWPGDLITDKALSTDCFDLSDNYIEVIRQDCTDMPCDEEMATIRLTDENTQYRTVVANRASGTISVVNGNLGTLAGTYTMPDAGEPMYVVYHEATHAVLVGDYNGKVASFDATDFSVMGSATAGNGVFHMWLSPNGEQLWVNNELDKTISVINPFTMETITTFGIPSDLEEMYKPHDVVVDPDNMSAYVTMLGSDEDNYVVKYSTTTFEETARAVVGEDPHVSLTPNTPYLYVAAQGADKVYILERSDLSLLMDIEVPNAHGLGMNEAGTHLYISNISDGGENAIYTLDLTINMLVGDPVSTPYAVPHNFSLGNSDSKLYITHSGGSSDKLTIYDVGAINPIFTSEITVENNPFGLVSYSYHTNDALSICAGDGQSDAFDVLVDNGSSSSTWIITDDTGNILGLPPGPPFDLEEAPAGTCLVWYANIGDGFAGAEIGNNAFEDLSGCFALSNAITVYRTNMDGGEVMMPSGATERYTCPGDGTDDIVPFITTSNASNYRYVITDPDGNIIGLPPTAEANFEGAPAGICYVWGLAYSGTITAQIGDNAMEVALTDGCYDLSDNFITINRDEPDGGEVMTTDGETSVSVSVGDGTPDVISFMHESSSNSQYAYIITDDQNNVLGLPESNMQDFDGAPAGICRVWGLAYTGMINIEVGDNIDAIELSTDCYNLSNNYIEVLRSDSFTDGDTPQFRLASTANHIESTQIAPNPTAANTILTLTIDQAPQNTVWVDIYSTTGQLMAQKNLQAVEGLNQVTIESSSYPEGLYFVNIRTANAILHSTRFVKTTL